MPHHLQIIPRIGISGDITFSTIYLIGVDRYNTTFYHSFRRTLRSSRCPTSCPAGILTGHRLSDRGFLCYSRVSPGHFWVVPPLTGLLLLPSTLFSNSLLIVVLLFDINNSMASVRERTIPTERPPPVSEGSANC
jgi:hypothetical protein